jgi:hypothetical protein
MNARVIFVVVLSVAFFLSVISFASMWGYTTGSSVPAYEYALIPSNILACFGTVFVAYWVYEENEDSKWNHSHIYSISKRLDKIEETLKKEEKQKNL